VTPQLAPLVRLLGVPPVTLRNLEARPSLSRRWPSVARRLLQPKQPASTTTRSFEPQFTPRRLPSSARTGWGRSSTVTNPRVRHSLPAAPAEVSRVRGRAGSRSSGAFRRDCSRRKLRPSPISSDTSRRKLVVTSAGEAGITGCARQPFSRAHRAGPLSRGPTRSVMVHTGRSHLTSTRAVLLARSRRPTCPLTRTRHGPRAASHDLPRRRARSAAPEVPSIDALPRWGRPFSTSCRQLVDNERRLFDPLGARRTLTGRRERGVGSLFRGAGPKANAHRK